MGKGLGMGLAFNLWQPCPGLGSESQDSGGAGSLTGLIEGCLNVARHGGCHGWAWVVVVVRVCLWLSCRQQDRQVGLGSESQDWGGVWSAQADAQPAHGAMGHREGTEHRDSKAQARQGVGIDCID